MGKANIKKYFLNGKSEKDRKIFYKLIDICFDFINGRTRGGKVLVYHKPDFFKRLLSGESLPQKPIDYKTGFKLLKEISKYSISQADVNYLAFPDADNSIPGLMAEILSKFLNQNLIAFDRSAPIATFIEIQLIEWLRGLIGYGGKNLKEINSLSKVSGMWTTGGHMSNHIATMTALNYKFDFIKGKGLTSLKKPPKIVLADKISHYSWSAAMHHLGLGNENIINCDTNEDFTTNVESLENILKNHPDKKSIFMVVGVAGNTRTSGIDDLLGISRICKKYKVWFHVDACHGGSLIFSRKLKNMYLKGISQADSISLDPHKGMFVTYPSSYILFKKRDSLVKFTRYEDHVRQGTSWDLGYITPFFGSRGFESLKLWFLIKMLGVKGLAEVAEKRHEDAQYAAKLIFDSKLFSVFHQMTFYRMVFVYYPEEIKNFISDNKLKKEDLLQIKKCVDFYTHRLNQELYEEGNICLDEFKLHDLADITKLKAGEDRFVVMSITIGNPLFTKKSLKRSINYLLEAARKYTPTMKKDICKIIQKGKYDVREVKTYGPAGWK